MRQSELNRQVAKATGETVSTIKRLGFLIADPSEPIEDPDSKDTVSKLHPWLRVGAGRSESIDRHLPFHRS